MRPWSREGLKGALLCYSQERYSYQTQEPKKTLTDTEWHVDFISLVKKCTLLLKFSAPFPPGTPLPEELLGRIEAILTTLYPFPKGRITSPEEAVAATQAFLFKQEGEEGSFDLTKPSVEENMIGSKPKGWRVSYPRHRQWPDQTGRLSVIVSRNGRCALTDETEGNKKTPIM